MRVAFLLSLFLMFCLLTKSAVLAAASAKGSKDEIYLDSPLSNDAFLVTNISSGGRRTGCSAASKKSASPVFLTILADGSGTISVVGPTYSISTNKMVLKIPVLIAGRKMEKVGVVDGNVVTFDLTKGDIKNADHGPNKINGTQLDQQTYIGLHSIVASCLASQP
jgi:hypothetical protein